MTRNTSGGDAALFNQALPQTSLDNPTDDTIKYQFEKQEKERKEHWDAASRALAAMKTELEMIKTEPHDQTLTGVSWSSGKNSESTCSEKDKRIKRLESERDALSERLSQLEKLYQEARF